MGTRRTVAEKTKAKVMWRKAMSKQSGTDSECNRKSYSRALSPPGCFPSSLQYRAVSGLLILPTAPLFLGLGV